MATEVCGRDTAGGLRLAEARAALGDRGKVAAAAGGLTDFLAAPAASKRATEEVAPVGKKGKGGRPPGPNPWKDRKAEHLKAYRRAYMRGWRARRVGRG